MVPLHVGVRQYARGSGSLDVDSTVLMYCNSHSIQKQQTSNWASQKVSQGLSAGVGGWFSLSARGSCLVICKSKLGP